MVCFNLVLIKKMERSLLFGSYSLSFILSPSHSLALCECWYVYKRLCLPATTHQRYTHRHTAKSSVNHITNALISTNKSESSAWACVLESAVSDVHRTMYTQCLWLRHFIEFMLLVLFLLLLLLLLFVYFIQFYSFILSAINERALLHMYIYPIYLSSNHHSFANIEWGFQRLRLLFSGRGGSSHCNGPNRLC